MVNFGDESMAAIPSIILVFDVSALSAASCSEWREFARVGSCYLPQVVYEEMKMVFDRSPDPDLERIAKDFHRFHTTSNWNVTQANAHHAALKMGSGQSLTRRARVLWQSGAQHTVFPRRFSPAWSFWSPKTVRCCSVSTKFLR
ncbi:hypothetical protein FM036_46020 [Nostoc sp. HG1]|nr:hypothetical protein [Nostoc sp. HG1]